MYSPLFVMQWRMPSGMPDTSVMHIRRNLSPCLLHLPAARRWELFATRWRCPAESPEVFSGTGLCAVPRSNISHTEKEQVVETLILRLFGRAQGISTRHDNYLLASGKIVRVVT